MSFLDRIKDKIKKETIISKEAAEDQIILFIGYYDFDIPTLQKTDEHGAFETLLETIKTKIMEGDISIEDVDGVPVIKQTLSNGKVIEYGEPNAQSCIEKNKYKDNDSKMLGVLGAVSGQGIDIIRKLKGKDRMTAYKVGNLFLLIA